MTRPPQPGDPGFTADAWLAYWNLRWQHTQELVAAARRARRRRDAKRLLVFLALAGIACMFGLGIGATR